MLKKIFQKYWIYICIFFFFDLYLFSLRLNEGSALPYLNHFIYFLSFLVVGETLPKTKLNKNIVYLFYFFYGYLSIILSVTMLLRPIEPWNVISWNYSDTAIKLFIILISTYLAFYSYRTWIKNKNIKLLISLLLACLVIVINFNYFLSRPLALSQDKNWAAFAVSSYSTTVLSIIVLLIFWIRYYKKYFVLSEYLNLVIFIFTLSNLVETLHFIAFQHEFDIFIYGQIFSFVLNASMLIVWYMRLSYLQTEISIENERYLENFKYLGGLVSKPKKSFWNNKYFSTSSNIIVGVIVVTIAFILTLYFVNKITFYLVVNTIFILIAVILAIFFGFSSIKRDWNNQIGFLFKNKK